MFLPLSDAELLFVLVSMEKQKIPNSNNEICYLKVMAVADSRSFVDCEYVILLDYAPVKTVRYPRNLILFVKKGSCYHDYVITQFAFMEEVSLHNLT